MVDSAFVRFPGDIVVAKFSKWLLLPMVVLALYNSCGAPIHTKQYTSLSSLHCDKALEETFAKTYHPFLMSKCSTCHVAGGLGSGVFAGSNLQSAFTDFMKIGQPRVVERAVDGNHKPPYSGPANAPTINGLLAQWSEAESQYRFCLDQAVSGVSGIKLQDQVIGATDTPKTLTWDLGKQIVTPAGLAFSGGKFKVDVKKFVPQGASPSAAIYEFTNARITAGSLPLHVSVLEVHFNGRLDTTATTWKFSERKIPAGKERVIVATSGSPPVSSSLLVSKPPNPNDRVAFSFEVLEGDPNFNPPTYTQLIAQTGVLGGNCVACHGASNPSSGLNMSSYSSFMSSGVVVPFSEYSLIITRMTSTTNPMPTAGRLSESKIKAVKDWIADGAPEN